MIRRLFALLCIAWLVQAATTDTTSIDNCPPLSGTSRSVWSILGSCGLTLLICVWHTIHFPVPKDEWQQSYRFRILCVVGSFFAPEVLIALASQECWSAYRKVVQFKERGYSWSMKHSYFAGMGGFIYQDRTIRSIQFLDLCEQGKIANPDIAVKDIGDKSKSDWPGKTILALQLAWFMLQVVARGLEGLAVTLVELDTVCMAVLSLIVIALWWEKPLRPERPHVFYSPSEAKHDLKSSDMNEKSALSNAWKPEPTIPDCLSCCVSARGKDDAGITEVRPLVKKIDKDTVLLVSLCITWLILGGLHLIAWNFEFPTQTEKIIWRAASLVLATGPLPVLICSIIFPKRPERNRPHPGKLNLPHRAETSWDWDSEWRWQLTWRSWKPSGLRNHMAILVFVLGVIPRALLVGLMLASLRALPCSAHETVAWTTFIPHL